jgi:hypothetical protein
LSSTVLQQLAPILLLREPDGDVIGISNLHGIGGVASVTRWPWVMPVEAQSVHDAASLDQTIA